jgi:uncharacterized protein YlxW (UPF0749 family)
LDAETDGSEMKDSVYRPALVAVVAVLGLLVAVAFNTTQRAEEAPSERGSDLVTVVEELESDRDQLEERLAELREEMDVLEREAADDSGVRETYSAELERAREAAGLTAVVGPGVEITLGDGTDVSLGGDPNDYLIHDRDLSAVVNALLAGGAEAVDVDGERVVATTPIRCAGTTVLVNASRLGSPYVIRAVGDPETLEEAVMDDSAASLLFTQYKSQFGLQADIDRQLELTIEPYRGGLRPEYVSGAEEES